MRRYRQKRACCLITCSGMESYNSAENNLMERKISEFKFVKVNVLEYKTTDCKLLERNIAGRIIVKHKVLDHNMMKIFTGECKMPNCNTTEYSN